MNLYILTTAPWHGLFSFEGTISLLCRRLLKFVKASLRLCKVWYLLVQIESDVFLQRMESLSVDATRPVGFFEHSSRAALLTVETVVSFHCSSSFLAALCQVSRRDPVRTV